MYLISDKSKNFIKKSAYWAAGQGCGGAPWSGSWTAPRTQSSGSSDTGTCWVFESAVFFVEYYRKESKLVFDTEQVFRSRQGLKHN